MAVNPRQIATLGLTAPAVALCIATLGIVCDVLDPGTGPFPVDTAPCHDVITDPCDPAVASGGGSTGGSSGLVTGTVSGGGAGGSGGGGFTGSTSGGSEGSTS